MRRVDPELTTVITLYNSFRSIELIARLTRTMAQNGERKLENGYIVTAPPRRLSFVGLMSSGCHLDPSYTPKHLVRDCANVKDVGDFDSLCESRILVLYTGGTIGMKNIKGVYSPYPNFLVKELRKLSLFHDSQYIQENKAQLTDIDEDKLPLVMPLSKSGKRIIYTVWEYEPLLDSCNMTMTDWARLTLDIKNNYDEFDGFVVLHGTDTMAYTASALSFMLENLGKPVILTGSQIPIFETRSDGRDNFLGALITAGHYSIPEVCIYFNHRLLRGNRAQKVDSGAFNAFQSPNLSPIAEMEIDIHVNWNAVFRPSGMKKFSIHTTLSPNVGLLRLFPSITVETVKGFLPATMEGVVLQTYGAGNGPDSRGDLLAVFKEASDRGVIFINTTQCARGAVSVSYAAGKALNDAGILPGADMTPEAALTKLAYVLGKKEWSLETKKKMMTTNLRGEMKTLTDNQDKVFELPIVENLKETLRISSEEEANMLKEAVYPSLMCTAAKEGNLEALKQLKKAGALFDQADYDGRTPLHLACAEGHLVIIKFLLEYGAPVHVRDRYGNTPLDDAVRFDNHDAIRMLIKTGAHLNEGQFQLGTALCHAVMFENTDRIKSWHLAGADLNQGDYDQRTALHVAISYRHTDIIKFLLDAGARTDVMDNFGKTAMGEAVGLEDEEILALLEGASASSSSPKRNQILTNGTHG